MNEEKVLNDRLVKATDKQKLMAGKMDQLQAEEKQIRAKMRPELESGTDDFSPRELQDNLAKQAAYSQAINEVKAEIQSINM